MESRRVEFDFLWGMGFLVDFRRCKRSSELIDPNRLALCPPNIDTCSFAESHIRNNELVALAPSNQGIPAAEYVDFSVSFCD